MIRLPSAHVASPSLAAPTASTSAVQPPCRSMPAQPGTRQLGHRGPGLPLDVRQRVRVANASARATALPACSPRPSAAAARPSIRAPRPGPAPRPGDRPRRAAAPARPGPEPDRPWCNPAAGDRQVGVGAQQPGRAGRRVDSGEQRVRLGEPAADPVASASGARQRSRYASAPSNCAGPGPRSAAARLRLPAQLSSVTASREGLRCWRTSHARCRRPAPPPGGRRPAPVDLPPLPGHPA